MCGIPMLPPEPPQDAVKGAKLTFEQCLEHVGGRDRFLTEAGRALAKRAAHDYIWKYTAEKAAWCTACGVNVGDMKQRHGHRVACPACGKEVEFRHAARSYSHEFEQFCLYEWRRSAIDAETIVLTAMIIWRDCRKEKRPERAPLNFDYEQVYVFRPGKAVSVYKAGWHGYKKLNAKHWYRQDKVRRADASYSGCKIVQDYGDFRRALEGTRIGRTFDLLNEASNRRDTVELTAVANCARKPWLEYLAKSGQTALAAELMRMDCTPQYVAPRQRAKTPRELLGLNEGQWYEIRREGIRLSCGLLESLGRLRQIGLDGMKVRDVLAIQNVMTNWRLSMLQRSKRRDPYATPTIGDMLFDARVPEKLRRKAFRRIVNDLENAQEWRDYYVAVTRAGENLADPRWLLPRDMHALHDRMTARERAIREEEANERNAAKSADFRKRLEKLRRKYVFCACGLVMRPYESAAEIMAEGRALDICIGSYADGYIEGRNIICCLRKAEEPDEPWRAVEFSTKDGHLVQDRGYKNDWAYSARHEKYIEPGTQKQLRTFWAAWERYNKKEVAA